MGCDWMQETADVHISDWPPCLTHCPEQVDGVYQHPESVPQVLGGSKPVKSMADLYNQAQRAGCVGGHTVMVREVAWADVMRQHDIDGGLE